MQARNLSSSCILVFMSSLTGIIQSKRIGLLTLRKQCEIPEMIVPRKVKNVFGQFKFRKLEGKQRRFWDETTSRDLLG